MGSNPILSARRRAPRGALLVPGRETAGLLQLRLDAGFEVRGEPAFLRLRPRVDAAQIRLEIDDRRAVEEVEAAHREHAALDVDRLERDAGQPDRRRAVRSARGENAALRP